MLKKYMSLLLKKIKIVIGKLGTILIFFHSRLGFNLKSNFKKKKTCVVSQKGLLSLIS